MVEVEGIVESVEPLWKDDEGRAAFFKVTLKDKPEPFALHQNWFAAFGDLNPGDHVIYEPSEAKLAEYGYVLFNKLIKVEEKKPCMH